MVTLIFLFKQHFPDFLNITLGHFWVRKLPKVMLIKMREIIFKKKIKNSIQSGIQKAPMQAVTALCRTKIVAATVIQRQAGFFGDFF